MGSARCMKLSLMIYSKILAGGRCEVEGEVGKGGLGVCGCLRGCVQAGGCVCVCVSEFLSDAAGVKDKETVI